MMSFTNLTILKKLYTVRRLATMGGTRTASQRLINFVNNKCDLVIYGSGILGGCALLMIIYS